MLDIDVLVLIYHMAKMSQGAILEIGSFLGASTIAAGLGMRDSGAPRKFISIEPGGRLRDHRLASKDIFRDLKRNLARAELLETVTLINAFSFDEETVSTVRQNLGLGRWTSSFSTRMRRPARHRCYGDRLATVLMVIDDYISASDKAVRPGPSGRSVAAGRCCPSDFTAGGRGSGLARVIPRKIFRPAKRVNINVLQGRGRGCLTFGGRNGIT